jgi:hypothetical protein
MEEHDTTEMEACHRSNSGELLAVANSQGQVRVYNYPCLKKGVSQPMLPSLCGNAPCRRGS